MLDLTGAPDRLKALLDKLSGAELNDVASRVSDAAPEIPVDPAQPAETDAGAAGLPHFLDRLGRMPAGTGFFDFGPEITLGRLTNRIISRIEDPDHRLAVVKAAIANCQTLSARNILVTVSAGTE